MNKELWAKTEKYKQINSIMEFLKTMAKKTLRPGVLGVMPEEYKSEFAAKIDIVIDMLYGISSQLGLKKDELKKKASKEVECPLIDLLSTVTDPDQNLTDSHRKEILTELKGFRKSTPKYLFKYQDTIVLAFDCRYEEKNAG